RAVGLLAVRHAGGAAAAAAHRLQGAPDVGHAHAQVGGARAVDVQPHLRAGFLVVGVHGEEARVRLHALHHHVAPARDLLVLGPAQHQLDRLAAAAEQAAADARLRLHAAQGAQLGAQRIGHLGRGLRALVPVLEEHADVAGVHLLARAPPPRRARVVAADGAALIGHAAREDLLDLAHLLHGVVEAGALGAHDAD